jgi:spore maturation protein CgeB
MDGSIAPLKITVLGLSITSSWGNGHATTYRGLLGELARRGHEILFLERDRPCYAANRDLPHPPYIRTELYASFEDLKRRFAREVEQSDCVIVGSYVPEGVRIGEWVTKAAKGMTAFYDIDTPVTMAKLQRGDFEYLTPALIPQYRIYLSFAGGPTLHRLEHHFHSPCARALYCSVDPDLYFPNSDSDERPRYAARRFDLGYLGTYSEDRQPALDRLLLAGAAALPELKLAVAGPQYPSSITWPANVKRIEYLPPSQHRAFYNQQRFALNITRADMLAAGYSPSIRLFEAAACGTPVISDEWQGLSDFFEPDSEIIIARSANDVVRCLTEMSEAERAEIGRRARARVLAAHTAAHRAQELERCIEEVYVHS